MSSNPVCPTHGEHMERGRVVLGVPTISDRIEFYLYFCEADCSKVYDPDRGYFDWVPALPVCEMVDLAAIDRVRCRKCNRFMHISDQVDPQSKSVIWRCSTRGCASTITKQIVN
jgi:hypothetical protein